MTPRESDLEKIRGGSKRAGQLLLHDLDAINRGVQSSSITWYGERIERNPEENWWDPISSSREGQSRTNISSLNDDNRQDEKEIELLEEASKITDEQLTRYKESEDYYTNLHLEALRNGDRQLAEFYRQQAIESRNLYMSASRIRKDADDLVNKDKQLFTLSGHNPILEALGEIASYTMNSAAVGSLAGGALGSFGFGIGAVPGSIAGATIGAAAGLLYGGYDYLFNGKSKIDTSAYDKPLSAVRNENYINSIKTRQSYKEFRNKEIQDELEDIVNIQRNAPISDHYRYMEALGNEGNTSFGNYIYYNMPGILGSSFSDTKHQGQQMIGSFGLNHLAKVIPYGKHTIRAIAFANALKAGWQASLSENHAEASDSATKKVLNEVKKNKELSDEMMQVAKDTATRLYGLSNSEANELVTPEVAFTMFQAGLGGLDPRQLKSGYQYYKAARKLGDNGADTQFARDMMATASGDLLEATAMVFPYSAIAKKGKVLGRAIAGAAIGASAGEFAGFGTPGAIIGGATGALAAQVPFARKLWRKTAKNMQAIADNALPKLEKQVLAGKLFNVGSAFGVTAMAEAAEEGTQYLNALDAEKILTEAEDDLNLQNMKNLFVNDLKKRGEVFKAVLSNFGLAESPYQNDAEFWANYKGGLILGGLMTGATTSIRELAGAKKAYQAAKYLREEVLSSALANRAESQDAIEKGARFAKYGRNGNLDSIIEVIDKAKAMNSRREDTAYSDEDFDNLKEQAYRIITNSQYGPTVQRLRRLGYEPGSEKANYALSIFDYYTQLIRQAKSEGRTNWVEVTKLLADPEITKALDMLTGTDVKNDGVDDTTGEFVFNIKQNDGSVVQESISNRERLTRLHKAAAQLTAVTQLLSDLADIKTMQEYAKTKGIAFNGKQADRSISSLKKVQDQLKNQVEVYSGMKMDTETTSYQQQIDYLKTHMLPVESNEKLIEAYRETQLLNLNVEAYGNIIKSIGLGGENKENHESAKKASHKIVDMFIKHVKDNEELQQIVDFNIENNFPDDRIPYGDGSSSTAPDIADPGFETMSEDSIYTYLTSGNVSPEQAIQFARQKALDYQDEAERFSRKIFGKKQTERNEREARLWERIADRLAYGDHVNEQSPVDDTYTEIDNANTVEEQNPIENVAETVDGPTPITDEQLSEIYGAKVEGNTITWTIEQPWNKNDQQQSSQPLTEEEEASPTPVEDKDNGPATIDDNSNEVEDTTPVAEGNPVDDAPIADNSQIDTAPLPDDDKNAVIIEDGNDGNNENTEVDPQQTAVDAITAPVLNGPTKITDGWYLDSEGNIIPSERMYMANPVETKRGLLDRSGILMSEKYLRNAAEIRFQIWRLLHSKKDKDLRVRAFVGERLKGFDDSIINTIANGILREDPNATKMLLMYTNPRTWESYYRNEYFREAFKRLLNGQVVNRPVWMDSSEFSKFIHNAIRYRDIMENRYGWKFITNISPSIVEINVQKVVGDPDFVAIDKEGNIHVVDIHTMKNDDYQRWGNDPIKMTNTKNIFSIMEERCAYVDIQIKALQSKPGVQVSSAVLLPAVVDQYSQVHRFEIGKMIPVEPSADAVTKYANQEDQMQELKSLLKLSNEKAQSYVDEINSYIDKLKEYRKKYKTSGYRFKNKFEFKPEEEPTSIAEAYAQLDRVTQFVQKMVNFKADNMQKEIDQMEAREKEEGYSNKQTEISKEIARINAIKDETWTDGVEVEIPGSEDVFNNSDFLTKGIVRIYAKRNSKGELYIAREIEYNDKIYPIKIKQEKKKDGTYIGYGDKNGGRARTKHQIYTDKMKLIEQLISEHPEITLSIDLRRSFITYAEKPAGHKPIGLNESESIISQHDIDNLGVQQDDGKIVNIGFYDEKTGEVQSGARSTTAVLGRVIDGDYWQNQLMLVIKQNHAENRKQTERKVVVPLTRSKFNAKIAKFVGQCFRIIAETNHSAEENAQKKRQVAIRMLHFFIGQRLTYKPGQEELPNIVYTKSESGIAFGDVIRLNGRDYNIINNQDLSDLVKELQKCEIMPRWDTFNSKFRNLADSTFLDLYSHFSESNEDFHIAIDGVDSGLVITKKDFDSHTLCQWYVNNGFLGSRWFVSNDMHFTMHDLQISGPVEEKVQKDKKEEPIPSPKVEVIEETTDEEEAMTEEEYKKWLEENGGEEVDEDEELDSYSKLTEPSEDYETLRQINTAEEAINLVSNKYKFLGKLLYKAAERIGIPVIHFDVKREQGEKKIINGVERQKKGSVKRNEDGSWNLILYSNAKIKTLAHELVHIYTLGAIRKNTQFSRAGKIFYSYCKEVFTKEEKQLYAFENFDEFVAEFFTNPELITLLKSKGPIDPQVMKTIMDISDIKPKNIWENVASVISKFWHKYILREKESSYTQIYGVMKELLKDAYQYEGVGSYNSMTAADIIGDVIGDIKAKLSGRGYKHKNYVTNQTVRFQNAETAQDLREAIDGIMCAWIEHDGINPIGKDIDKIKFSTKDIEQRIERDPDFAEWWHEALEESSIPLVREIAEIEYPYGDALEKAKYEAPGYETKVIKINGKVVKKRVRIPNKTYYKVKAKKWDAITPIIDEYMADMRIETRKKIETRKEDEEMQSREEGRNTFGELLTESYEIDPFERASREVKFMFSTVPYADTSHNKYGMRTFMPFRDVFGKVLYYTARDRSVDEVLGTFYRLSQTGPDKEMFDHLYKKLTELRKNIWIDEKEVKKRKLKSNQTKNEQGKIFDANYDSMIIKVMRTLRQQENDFVWATVDTKYDEDGTKNKDISIKTTLYEKGARIAVGSWMDQLTTGLSGAIKYDEKTASFKFQRPKDGNIFKQIFRDLFNGKESFLYAYDKYRDQNPEDITVHWRYLPKDGVKFSDLTIDDIKTYFHNALLECGIDVRSEVIDLWLNQIMKENRTVKDPIDAFYLMLADRNSLHMPINFFSRLATDEELTLTNIKIAFESGFVSELAKIQNEYDLKTQSLMTTASHNNQYYIVSESNYVNDIAAIINSGDDTDSYIQMLKEDAFAQGSVIAQMLANGEKVDLHVATFVGMKTKNVGDTGRDYFEIELNEDVISKYELLSEGYMLSPTVSDKKTYHTLKGIPLVGIMLGKRKNTDCYYTDLRFNTISISDKKLLNTFIKYFESEKNAVEKAIQAYESEFYKKNPGKKIENYSDKNGMRFSSFNCIPLANGEPVYLNLVGDSPRDSLNKAYQYFFGDNVTTEQRQEIMARILLQRAQTDIKKAVELGLISKDENGLYHNIGLDGATIKEMALNIGRYKYGNDFTLGKKKDETGKWVASDYTNQLISAAIQQYIIDVSIKHMQSMQEYQRLFSGSKSFYKWKNNGTHITDISVDYTKRRGGDISTGGVNVTDIDPIAGMEELGTYRCIEIQDQLIESTFFSQDALEEQFYRSELAAAASVIQSGWRSSTLDLTNFRLPKTKDLFEDIERAEKICSDKYGEDFVKLIKQKAKNDAQLYFKENKPNAEDPVNVADGATYISDKLCEKLLREEGKFDDDMKYAFEVLRGEHGADVMSEKGRELYKSILDVVVGTQKYTATGFRKSDDGMGGTLMTPYYNKTALFPIFDQIAYGKIAQIRDAMRKNNVDMMMMTSAVKTGSQGSISVEQFLSDSRYDDHTYVQELRFLRKQLNTDPNEREEMNLGTQTIKIALSNLRMNDDYTDPFTGKTIKGRDLYKKIMRAYNILTDIGFEQVMRRFSKKDPKTGAVSYNNILPVLATDSEGNPIALGDEHFSLPEIDEKALSDFLHEELMSRDANDNMFAAIGYDSVNDRLAAPLSAISQSGWIDSIIASYINKTIIDTKSPGAAYIQRSVFCMEGEGNMMINEGDELKPLNDDGSMDAVVSVDFFKDIVPDYENKTFEEVKEWLQSHRLVGKDAFTYTISYRIPTQAQASINALKFVDVIPIVRDTIILPKEFTKLTGSDFDIDKLFLSRMFINNKHFNDVNNIFTFTDNKDYSQDERLEALQKGFTNNLYKQYMTLLMDKNSANTKQRPIDSDTELWREVYNDLYSSKKEPIQSLSQDTIAYQTEQKNNFVVGKIGIGPYALNNNNHIYTMLYGISVHGSGILGGLSLDGEMVNMNTLYMSHDIYGNSILSWLSGGINAHVDIAKDPFVTSLNINKYTYNISNFLLRAGFGRNGLWFLNLPVIKELSRRMNNISGQYLKANSKSEYEAQQDLMKEYKDMLAAEISDDIKGKEITIDKSTDEIIENSIGHKLTIGDILFNRYKVYSAIIKNNSYDKQVRDIIAQAFIAWCNLNVEKKFTNDMIEKNKEKSILYRMVKGTYIQKEGLISSNTYNIIEDESVYNYVAIIVFDKINQNEAKTTSDLTRFAKIDTKKQGSTVAAQIDFLDAYEKFVTQCSNPDSPSNKVEGDIYGFFGLLPTNDLMGFDTSLILNGQHIQNVISGGIINGQTDITEAGYVGDIFRNEILSSDAPSFIDNKTKKAINALTAIIRNDSIEGTYGFQLIWKRIKNDLGKHSLSEDAQSKLRSAILGAIKNIWAINAMKKYGLDPVSLFRDSNDTLSLSHELIKLKRKGVFVERPEGGRRLTSIGDKYKNNALLNMLFDAHAKDEYLETDKLIEVLDFIKVHVPFTDDTKKANVYIKAWRDLYNDEDTQDFAIKLMFYSLLTSNDSGGNNLFKYVPFEMLEDFGLFDAERALIQQLGDPSAVFAKSNADVAEAADEFINDICERVESILVEDFDFSTPYNLTSKQEKQDKYSGRITTYDRPEYIGFGNVFNSKEDTRSTNEKAKDVPYVFIPARLVGDKMYNSWTMSGVTKKYIRVINPKANKTDNQQKYLTYKRIGYVTVYYAGKMNVLPIYQLTNSALYTLGNYKVYNYNNEMSISSSQAVTDTKKRRTESPYTIEELNDLIFEAVDEIQNQDIGTSLRTAVQPLIDVDEKVRAAYKTKEYEDKINRVKNIYIPRYDNSQYIDYYRNVSEANRPGMMSDLEFAKNAKDFFTEEEINLINDMIRVLKAFNEALRQSKEGMKGPKNIRDPRTYHMHSGGADGADSDWHDIAVEFGMIDNPSHISHYYWNNKPNSRANVPITSDEYSDGVKHVLVADQVLHRTDNMEDERIKKVLPLWARNWVQVKNASEIFAIGVLKRGVVDGGTGWAVQMAIDAGKPVHVFDLNDERWYKYNPDSKSFEYENTPRLSKDFAGIGTRSIDPNIEEKTSGYKHPVKYIGDEKRQAALKAMKDVFKNTFGEPKKQDDLVQQEKVKSNKTSLQTAIEKAEGFIGETNGSVYQKQGDKFVLKSGTQLLDALKIITDRGHNPGKWSFGDDYDGQVSYNIGYESGTNAVMSVTNRDLYDEGWMPSTILAMREDNRIGNPLDQHFKQNVDQFGKDVTFLVSEKDKPLLEYLNSRGYKYEIYDKSSTEDTEIIKTVQDNGKIRLSLPSHTDEKPRQIVLEPQGNNKYYVHIRIWDGEKVPGKISDEDKQKLFDALYNELPDGAEILLPKSEEGYYATRGTIAAMQRLARDNRFTPGTKGVVKYQDKDGSIKEYEGTSFIKKSQKKEPVFTKVNDAFAEVLIKHLLNDPMPGYETKEKREFLANLARGVFKWLKRENFKVLITNAPYSDVEAGKTSTVSIFASFATIYYQDVDLQGGKYLNILHELLHIVTKQAIPFDSMGRAIADEKMQLYYDMFKRKVMSDPEWKDIQNVVFNPTQETFDKASNRAKILAHAYSDAGEFISCCISNVEVQQVLESITYDETQKSTLFDEIKRWFGELLDKIFRGNEKLSHSNFIEDVTNFLFDVKYDMGYVHQMLDSGDFEAQSEYLKYINSLSERYNKAIDFGSKNASKKVSVSTTTYTSESVKNPRTAVVFTENMQAEYARRNNTPSSSTLKVNVTEGTTGTNQAVVRMSDDTTYNPNAFGLIVKKYQQDNHGRWFYDDKGNFQDTDADFSMFKEANEAMFDRLSSFDGDTIVFPASAAMGKAALPKRFAEWLAQELYERYGLFTVVKPNPKYPGKFGIYIYENTGIINVYSKAGNTNLSNFEARPYHTQVSKTYPAVDVNHVEHAFQLAKAVFANQHGDISDYELFTIQKDMQNASPEECRRIGRSLKMSPATLAEWNKVSSKMLEAQMRRSFNAHPEVTAELLRTGDAKITHNYPNGNPIDERFGPILEKIRSDIRKEQELDEICN